MKAEEIVNRYLGDQMSNDVLDDTGKPPSLPKQPADVDIEKASRSAIRIKPEKWNQMEEDNSSQIVVKGLVLKFPDRINPVFCDYMQRSIGRKSMVFWEKVVLGRVRCSKSWQEYSYRTAANSSCGKVPKLPISAKIKSSLLDPFVRISPRMEVTKQSPRAIRFTKLSSGPRTFDPLLIPYLLVLWMK
jgi:hypothetical protein